MGNLWGLSGGGYILIAYKCGCYKKCLMLTHKLLPPVTNILILI